MNQKIFFVGIIVVALFLGACSVKEYDTYGVVSFKIRNVD